MTLIEFRMHIIRSYVNIRNRFSIRGKVTRTPIKEKETQIYISTYKYNKIKYKYYMKIIY